MKALARLTALLTLLLSLLGSAVAQEATDCTVIIGSQVEMATGSSSDALVVIKGERIAAVGNAINGLELQPGVAPTARYQGGTCQTVDAVGSILTAGLIEVSSALGLVEIGLEQKTRHHEWEEGPNNRAGLRASDAYNPRSSLVPVARLGGLTSALVVPTGGLISGQSALVDLSGNSQQEAIVLPSAAVHANPHSGSSRAAGLYLLRQALDDARFLLRNPSAHQQGRSRDLSAPLGALRALAPVIENKIPLVLKADRAADIEAALRLAEEQNLRLVISGGAEAWLLADQLATSKSAVVIDPMVYGPGSFDQLNGRPDNAVLLDQAGVNVIISSFSSHRAGTLRQSAGNAVRAGLKPSAALWAITGAPAQAFGMPDRGEIRAGGMANLVLWSGDPLELSSVPQRVFIRGEQQALQSRQTELRERYRNLPGSPIEPPPLLRGQ